MILLFVGVKKVKINYQTINSHLVSFYGLEDIIKNIRGYFVRCVSKTKPFSSLFNAIFQTLVSL